MLRSWEVELGASVLRAARNAALGVPALKWENKALSKGDLPEDLLVNRNLVLIYLLPKIFAKLDFRMSSFNSSLWQYGKGDLGKLNRNTTLPGTEYYWQFKTSDFDQSITVKKALRSTLNTNVNLLSKIGSTEGITDERWGKLRSFAADATVRNKEKASWSVGTPDYRNAVTSPAIYLGYTAWNTADFLVNGEMPNRSDAYGAMGPFATRSYLHADIKKYSGDETIYVKPKRVGVRIWDSYDFNNNDWVGSLVGFLASGRASQFLGSWLNPADASAIVLQNADFIEFRNKFMPRYNQFLEEKRSGLPRLQCKDFYSFSEYVEKEITAPDEYALLK